MDEVLLKITNECLGLENIAYETYKYISENSKDRTLAEFFRNMALEEKEHIEFWKNVYSLVESGAIENIIDNEYELLEDVKKTIDVANGLRTELSNANDNRKIFLLAFYLETYIMRPSFGIIFQFVKNISSIKNPIDTYQIHLEKFINQFKNQNIDDIEVTSIANIIFQLYRENVELSRISYVDTLSGLLNRRGLFSSLYTVAHILSRNGRSAAMIMIDIDNFKKTNDEYGHQMGDQIISSVGTIIKSCIRNSDIAGRFGGEEFLILLPDIRQDMIVNLADSIRIKVKTEFLRRFPVTVSAGCSYAERISNPLGDINALIKKADENLYKSKRDGKDRTTFEQG
ncbi:MAG: diguanylate cyclase [Deltaproteobacteria bacterium]|nr:diguanylate cyclase [Deltaproteobacteria bacterium]